MLGVYFLGRGPVRVTVLGAGAFGTAVAAALSKTVENVFLWSRSEQVVEELLSTRENALYLPGLKIPAEIKVTPALETALLNSSAVLLCVPTQELRNLCGTVCDSGHLDPTIPVLVCSKGIENVSLKLASEVVEELLPSNPVYVLSGPALAKEIMLGLPCAMALAGKSWAQATSLSQQLSSSTMFIVPSKDWVGVQIGAAMKNIIAIACGIVAGRGLGNNAIAMVIVQGLAEIQAMCAAKAGNADLKTISGYACLGDLVLTCMSPSSRNMSFGFAVGQNGNATTQDHNLMLVEGASSAPAVESLGCSLGVELPICSAISQLLCGKMTTDQVIDQIISGPFE